MPQPSEPTEPTEPHAPDGPLHPFVHEERTYAGVTRSVYVAGTGPAVVVIHEIPGITPRVAAFGRRVVDAGFRAYLPSLFGTPGKPPSPAYLGQGFARACVAREFATWATGRTSPVTDWLRALAADAHAECGGPGVGAVGMCLTGGFALAMAVDPSVTAPVCSQPSIPLPVGRARAADVGLSPADAETVAARAAAGELAVLGLRFTHDRLVPAARFTSLHRLLGDAFVAVEIDSSPGNPHGIRGQAHSVLTEDLVDEPGHPTRAALEQVLALFAERLRA